MPMGSVGTVIIRKAGRSWLLSVHILIESYTLEKSARLATCELSAEDLQRKTKSKQIWTKNDRIQIEPATHEEKYEGIARYFAESAVFKATS
jgi:hypothetical protein